MSQGSEPDGADGPTRRQLLGLLGAGGITALSAALVITGASLGSDDGAGDANESATGSEPAILSVSWDATYGGGPSAFTAAVGPTAAAAAADRVAGANETANATAGNETANGTVTNETVGNETSANETDANASSVNATDAAPEARSDVVAAGGVRTGDDDAGEGWLVGIEGPETTAFESTYVTQENRERRELGEGSQVFDAVETVVPDQRGWLLVGWTHDLSPDSKYPWAIAVDREGERRWQESYSRPGVNSFRDVFRDGLHTPDGGYLLAGVTIGAEFDDTRRGDGWLAKIDAEGQLTWDETYTPSGEAHTAWTEDDSFDGFTTIEATDGGYLLAGAATSEGPSDVDPSDAWVLAVDGEGAEQWSTTYEYSGGEDPDTTDLSISGIHPDDEGYLAVGTAGNYEYVRSFRETRLVGDGWISALGPEGEQRWERTVADATLQAVVPVDAGWLVTGAREGRPWAGVLNGEGELLDELVLHEVDGLVTAAATLEDGEVLLAGHRDDGETPIAFVTQLSPPVRDDED